MKGDGELLASIPPLLGFRPSASLVLLPNRGPGSKQIGRALRSDLPRPSDVDEVAERLADQVQRAGSTSVVLVVVGDGTPPADGALPHREFVVALCDELDLRFIAVPTVLWAQEIREGALWRCYDDPERAGTLPDPRATVAAAEIVRQGAVTYDSREEVERIVRPDAEPVRAERARLLDAKARDLRAGRGAPWAPGRGLAAVRRGLAAARTGILALSDEDVAELGLALHDPRVRDACLGTAVPPDTEDARAAARLWQALSRALPRYDRAPALALTAYAAYAAGDGVLAGIALEAAMLDDPDYALASLLMSALQFGVPPQVVQDLGRRAPCLDDDPEEPVGGGEPGESDRRSA